MRGHQVTKKGLHESSGMAVDSDHDIQRWDFDTEFGGLLIIAHKFYDLV